MSGLPWNWETKVADFVKPGDPVLTLGPKDEAGAVPYPDESFQVVLSRGPAREYGEVLRVLKRGGFFLMECTGSQSDRALAEYLLPGSRAAGKSNLENELPRMKAAGFRVMYRNQAYPVQRFPDLNALRSYIAERPERFPDFSEERCGSRLERLAESGALETTEHLFLLIGKKQ